MHNLFGFTFPPVTYFNLRSSLKLSLNRAQGWPHPWICSGTTVWKELDPLTPSLRDTWGAVTLSHRHGRVGSPTCTPLRGELRRAAPGVSLGPFVGSAVPTGAHPLSCCMAGPHRVGHELMGLTSTLRLSLGPLHMCTPESRRGSLPKTGAGQAILSRADGWTSLPDGEVWLTTVLGPGCSVRFLCSSPQRQWSGAGVRSWGRCWHSQPPPAWCLVHLTSPGGMAILQAGPRAPGGGVLPGVEGRQWRFGHLLLLSRDVCSPAWLGQGGATWSILWAAPLCSANPGGDP